MPSPQLALTSAASEQVARSLADLRLEFGLPAMFPPEVTAAAAEAAARDHLDSRADRRDLALVTIDPAGSLDLDQAVCLTRGPGQAGFVVYYAIADLAAFVDAGGPLDREVNRRGQTVYGPDARTPLHPTTLSEGAASLLPGEDRPAALWTITLDDRGEIVTARVERALVRSRERLTYEAVQGDLDSGTASPSLRLLAEVGTLRQGLERDRGGVSLNAPELEASQDADGDFELSFRSTLPVEGWNAQISLLTGIAAARLMRQAGVGIFRTLPPLQERDLARLRRAAAALAIDWPAETSYGGLLARLDSRLPSHAAFLNEATTAFRGAAYFAFGCAAAPGLAGNAGPAGSTGPTRQPGQAGAAEQVTGPVALPAADGPDAKVHGAIAAEYAHVTAPLRRLVDRYGTEICLAHCRGEEPPPWVRDALPSLAATMARTGRVAAGFERACLETVEAALLQDRVGEKFAGVIVDHDAHQSHAPWKGEVLLNQPAVKARVTGEQALPLGEEVTVTLSVADVTTRKVAFTLP